MGFGIIVQINGANLQGVYRGFGEGRVSQHIHLIFEALAGESTHMGKQIPGNSPETGLGIGHGYAVQKPEQGAGQKIAETAAEGNVILMEIAAAKQEKAILLPVKLLHFLIHPPDIRCQMLAVGVGFRMACAIKPLEAPAPHIKSIFIVPSSFVWNLFSCYYFHFT